MQTTSDPAVVTMAPTGPRTHTRYFMLALILGATVINYLDRTNMSIVAPFVAKELGIDKFHLGLIFSAFAWTYAFALLPGGFVVDRFGSRFTYGISLILWSVATCLQGLAGGFATLFGLRLAVGLMEAPAFPANNRAVTMWFPQRERGLATSVYVMGQYIGTALFSASLLWLGTTYGWRSVFYASGALGIVYGLVWFAVYRDPTKSKSANAAELEYIKDGGGLATNAERSKFQWSQVFELMSYRQVWAICIGKFASSSALYFFLTWFPTYLIEERHMTMLKTGIFTVLPYIGATIGILVGGAGSDLLIRLGYSMSFARKTPLVVGSLLGTSIVIANFVTSDIIVITVLSLAFFAQGVSSTSWAAVAELAPKELIGLTSGITSFAANLSGIVTPIVVGYIVRETGSFAWALGFVGTLALIGASSYAFLLGEIKRIVLRQPTPV